MERPVTAGTAEGGLAAVTIDALAERVEATKGSFYWHFASRDAVVTTALEEWERAETESVIERVWVMRDPEERLRALTLAAFEDRAGGLRDAALSASAEDPLVGPVLRRVTARRIGYLTELFEELGWVGRRARQRAVMAYASYVGLATSCGRAPTMTSPVGTCGPTPTSCSTR